MNPPAGLTGHNCRIIRELSVQRAFSLVEVVLALGIATFAIVTILALLPVGLQSSRNSIDESAALNILSSVVADRRATPLASSSVVYQLPALTNSMTSVTNTFGVADNDQPVASLNQARYRIRCVITPPAAGTLNPYTANINASWPALSTNSAASVEVVVTFPQP